MTIAKRRTPFAAGSSRQVRTDASGELMEWRRGDQVSDNTFTEDLEMVCWHAQCDLHTTTNILATPLAAKCSVPFTAAVLDADGNVVTPAAARCCTSDITLVEVLAHNRRAIVGRGSAA